MWYRGWLPPQSRSQNTETIMKAVIFTELSLPTEHFPQQVTCIAHAVSTVSIQGRDCYCHILQVRKPRLREIGQSGRVLWLSVAKPDTDQVIWPQSPCSSPPWHIVLVIKRRNYWECNKNIQKDFLNYERKLKRLEVVPEGETQERGEEIPTPQFNKKSQAGFKN